MICWYGITIGLEEGGNIQGSRARTHHSLGTIHSWGNSDNSRGFAGKVWDTPTWLSRCCSWEGLSENRVAAPSLSLSKFCQKESQQEGLQIQGQLDATGNAGNEPEASCRMMLRMLSLKPIIARPHRGAGEFTLEVIGCVGQGWNNS
jgi:hypothetical protein